MPTVANNEPNAWPPTPAQTLLLRFLLADADTARAAWRGWTASTDLERLDAASTAILPSVPARLTDLGIEEPRLEKLRGVSRHHWVRNRLLFDAGRGAVATLQAAGVVPVLAGGAAVLPRYRDWGGRQLAAVDLFVAADAVRAAAAALADSGWLALGREAARLPDAVLGSTARLDLRDTNGFEICLRWRAFDWRIAPGPGIDTMRTVASTIDAPPLAALDPTHLLLLACADDLASGDPPPLRLADVAALVRGGAIDWSRAVEVAERHAVAWLVARYLGWLATHCGLDVPADTLTRLSAAAIPAADRARERDGAPLAYRIARQCVRCARHGEPRWDVLAYLQRLHALPRRADVLRRLFHHA